MMHPPDLYSRTGMSTSLHFALSLGLRSLLDLHHTEEQLSSTDSFAQANSCAKSCANALRSSTGVVGAPSWGEAPGKPVPPVPYRRTRRPTLRRLGLLVDLLCAASTEEHMVLLMVLLERVLCASEGLLSKISWQPLLLCCFLLTSKELDDEPVSFRDLRMLAVMHDLRSAVGGYGVHGRFTVATHGESFSSCYNEAYNEAIEDMELQLLCSCCSGAPSVLPLTLSTAGSASSTGRSRSWPSPMMALRGQQCSARPTGSTCTSARMHARRRSSPSRPSAAQGLGAEACSMRASLSLRTSAPIARRECRRSRPMRRTRKPSSSQRGRPRAPAGVTVL